MKYRGLFLFAMLWAAMPADLLGGEPPAWLPRYDLDVLLQPAQRLAKVRQRVTWTNRHDRPAKEIVFNAHLHYSIPDQDVGLLAKMVEILRMAPSEALSFDGPALDMQKVSVHQKGVTFHYAEDNATALVVPLPHPVGTGESVTLDLEYEVRIPAKKGRWGQWDGITTLAQWIPVVAVYSEKGWDPAPFIPWHQPFHNEAGVYTVRVVLPKEQKLACSAAVVKERELADDMKEIVLAPICVRDFALVASDRFEEHTARACGVNIRVLALPRHDHYAKEAVKIICECLPVYNRWFGDYPYPQFTLVEACFGWNGNECGGLVMIDERMFNMPHMAHAYLDYLISHEFCHQWWYNIVGTNGYAESFMDEGLATYFSHRIINDKLGKENTLLEFPRGLEWLPNIRREDFRNQGMIGVRARGQAFPTVQEMPKFGHLVNLSAHAYDRGSKIIGMIEERLGEKAFLDFTRRIYSRYQYRILRVADYQKELEDYTGRSWEDFFQHWVHGSGMCDWSVERVEIEGKHRPRVCLPRRRAAGTVKVVVFLKQQCGFNEPTVLGISFKHGDGYPLRLPIIPEAPLLELEEGIRIHCQASDDGKEASVRVEMDLPHEPAQISVDPDRVLLDQCPTNNHWKPMVRWRVAPVYTQLEEADVTNAHDRWNVIMGPWAYASSYSDPWYSRSPLLGAKVGVYRTQEFSGGAFIGYRTNDRNIVAGVDAVWDHVPLPNTQVGITVEHSLDTWGDDYDPPCSRGVVYGRYVILYGSSLYLPPFEYAEVFGNIQNRCLPNPRHTIPGADLFRQRTGLGIHYHKNMMTPYWDPEAGMAYDIAYQYGIPIFGNQAVFQQLYGQAAVVKRMPSWLAPFDHPAAEWLRSTRWAFRLGGAAALPDRGQFFALGGADQFRGFDLQERQGSLAWVGSVEWRLPIFTNVCWDFCDHVGGVRNVYLAPFYDIGDAYLQGRSFGPVAHAFGGGLRVDIAWLGLIERTIIRFDVAKTINAATAVQYWVGVQHPF